MSFSLAGLPRFAASMHPGRWRLSSRLAAWSLLLLLLVQLMGLLATRSAIDHNARRLLADELAVAERVAARLLAQRAAQLGQGAALLAADYGFRAAVGSDDRETIVSALANQSARIDAGIAALLDPGYAVQAQSAGSVTGLSVLAAVEVAQLAPRLAAQMAPQLASRSASRSVAQSVAQSAAQSAAQSLPQSAPQPAPSPLQQGPAMAVTVAVVDGRAYQFVMVPLRAPVLIGWVLMGFELDHSVVADLHAVTGLHASLLLQPGRGAARLLHSSLAPADSPQQVPAGLLQAEAGTVQLDGVPHALRDVLLSNGAGGAGGKGSAASAQVLLRLSGSLDKAVAPYQVLQLVLAGLTLLGLVLFGLGSVWAARLVTRPLSSLLAASERLGRGDYDTALAYTARRDEFGELAKAFEHMRLNIGRQQAEIRQLAYWDRLTGLPNRLQFRDAVVVATKQGGPLAVVMLDLDRFKHVNDVLGYAFGDRLLQGVAGRLQAAVRPGDVVARLGGDEFALLLPQADATLAQAVAQRIAAAFETPLTLDDQRVDLSAGLGIACWPEHATEADALLSRAEVAMYAAKRRTAGAQLYTPALDSGSALTLSLLSELKHAVDNHELRLFLQPKIDVASGRLCGAEGLLRWQHPSRGLLPPLEFIPFAEQTGFVRQLTLWVFAEAARQQAALAALGIARVSVNLSTRDLMDLELPDKLEALLLLHHAQAERFCLEITESAIMDDPERAEATLNRLAQRGYKLSIDDFGTGYSSLAYLRRLPVQELKIDKSFVIGMQHSEGEAQIVRSTIDLAHNLGLSVVAEGVETEDILQALLRLGCDEAQGYHLSKPVPLPALQDWAARWVAARLGVVVGSVTGAVLAVATVH